MRLSLDARVERRFYHSTSRIKFPYNNRFNDDIFGTTVGGYQAQVRLAPPANRRKWKNRPCLIQDGIGNPQNAQNELDIKPNTKARRYAWDKFRQILTILSDRADLSSQEGV